MLNTYLELVLASLIFGTSGSFVKIINLPPTTMTFFRLAVPTIVLYFYLTFKKVKIFRGNYRLIMVASFLNALRLFLFFLAYSLATVGNAAIMQAVGPVFLFIYSYLFLNEKITKPKLILLATAIVGVALLYVNKPFSFSDKDFAGMFFALLSTAIYNLTLVVFKKELARYSRTETLFYQNVLGTFLFLPFLFINSPFPAFWQISVSIISQFFIGVVAFFLIFSAIKKISPVIASIATFDSVVSVILGIIIFKEILTWNMLFGGILIMMSSILIRREI